MIMIDSLKNPKIKYIKLRGFVGGNTDRQLAKQPVEKWQDSRNQYDYETAQQFAQLGYWVGMVVPVGMIVVDIDTPEGLDWLKANYQQCPILQETRNGYHALYALPSGISITGTHHTVNAGFKPTFRAGGKNYICVAPSEGYKWVNCGDMAELPHDLHPLSNQKISKPINSAAKNVEKIEKLTSTTNIKKDIYEKFGEYSKVSAPTFQLAREIENAKKGTKHHTRHSCVLRFVSWAKAGDVEWAEFAYLMKVAEKHTQHPHKTLSQMYTQFQYGVEKGYAARYRAPEKVGKSFAQVRNEVKRMVARKAKDSCAMAVYVTARELASIAPLNSRNMMKLLKEFKVRSAKENGYLVPVIRQKVRGIRAFFTASIVPVLTFKKVKTGKTHSQVTNAPQPIIEAMQGPGIIQKFYKLATQIMAPDPLWAEVLAIDW
jgi:hypothetical protein